MFDKCYSYNKDTLAQCKTRYLWVLNAHCDYSNFDFTWEPAPWESKQTHIWPSQHQEHSGTILVPKQGSTDKNYNHPTVQRKGSEPRLHIKHMPDSVDAGDVNTRYISDYLGTMRRVLRKVDWQYCWVTTDICNYEHFDFTWHPSEYQSDMLHVFSSNELSSEPQTKTVVSLTKGSSSVLIPREVKNHLKTQVYDYPYIDKSLKEPGEPLDIVFISNGESNAEQNWSYLNAWHTGNNRIVRVDGVKGRAEAYRAALEASNTDWAFCVFAKLEVDIHFDWTWQPDRLQEPKHYIFHAHNPVNGLEYGHMAMIAYNKRLVMVNQAQGLDFTLDQAHEVVPLLSGIARYADDPWIAWRSAFRECLKLKHSLPNIDNNYRLSQWLNTNKASTVAGWSAIGAKDAVDYYESVQGDFAKLRLTYEWEWLADYLFKLHNLTPDQLCTQLQDQ